MFEVSRSRANGTWQPTACKMAVVLMSEAHTPFVAPLLRDEYFRFREIARMRRASRSDDIGFDKQAHGNDLVIHQFVR